jgi:hypothetical protein
MAQETPVRPKTLETSLLYLSLIAPLSKLLTEASGLCITGPPPFAFCH